MLNKKVSVLSPCYNSEKYIADFLNSIISQNYSPIELILVDDGSTDNTAEIIKSFKEKLESAGIELKYFYKENGGQASAVALGIKQVTGEYLIWPDSDDILLKDSIVKRVEYLETHPECTVVRSNGYVYNEGDLKTHIGIISKLNRKTTFSDFLEFKVPWTPGCYMIRTSAFDKANPNRDIFVSSCGQNIQMLMPLLYYNDCDYFDEFLFGYIIHKTSHSHREKSYSEEVEHIEALRECMTETLKMLPQNTDAFLEIHNNFILRCIYKTAWRFGEKSEKQKYRDVLKQNKLYSLEEWIICHTNSSKFTELIIRAVSYIRRRLKGRNQYFSRLNKKPK